MAIYHLRVKYLKRSEGRSAVAAAAYRSGTKLEDVRRDTTHDYTKKQSIEHAEILLPEGLPETLRDRETLWNTVETGIKRKDGQPAFEIEVALPRELNNAQCIELVRAFAQDQLVSRGLVVDLAIHRPVASDGFDHPHAHMLISTRRFNPDGTLARAATDVQDNPALIRKVYALDEAGKVEEAMLVAKGTNLAGWRKAWADYSNEALARNHSDARIDHRTLEAQKIARNPVPYIAHVFYDKAREVSGWLSRRVNAFWAAQFGRDMHRQFESMERKRPDLLAEFVANANIYAKELTGGLRELDPAYADDIEPERGKDRDR